MQTTSHRLQKATRRDDPTPTLRSLCVIIGLSYCMMICGCDALKSSSLWATHMADDQHEAAQQRWNDVRGSVKLQVVEQHFKAGRLEDAESALRQVLSMSPNNAEVFKLATRIYFEQGQLAKARDTIDKAASLNAEDAETAYLAGIVAQRYGELDNALEHYMIAESLAPNVPDYVMAAAEMRVAQGELREALALIEPRIRDFDGCASMRMLAAQISRQLGLRNEALAHCREALRLQDEDERAEVEAALILAWAEAYDEAINILQPLVKKAEREPNTAFDRASRQNHESTVITPTVIYTLARAYASTQQWERSKAALKPLMSKDKSDMTAWSLYTRSALMSGDLVAADKAISTFNQRNAPTAETLLLQAYVAYKRGDYATTREAARRALQLDDRLELAMWLLGQAAQATGQIEQARAAYTQALALEPGCTVTRAMIHELNAQTELQSSKVTANRPAMLSLPRKAMPTTGTGGLRKSEIIAESSKGRSYE